MSRIVLTFKNNEQEKKIEEFLDSKLSPSGYIKELVWAVMNGKTPELVQTTEITKSTKKDDPADGFDFNFED